jgi:hypothetical protein
VESPKAAKLPRVESAAEYVLAHDIQVCLSASWFAVIPAACVRYAIPVMKLQVNACAFLDRSTAPGADKVARSVASHNQTASAPVQAAHRPAAVPRPLATRGSMVAGAVMLTAACLMLLQPRTRSKVSVSPLSIPPLAR